MGIMRYDSEVSSDVIKCHQMSLAVTTDEKEKTGFLHFGRMPVACFR